MLWVVACGNSAQRGLALSPANPSPTVQHACALAEVRCSSCHTIERITSAQYRTEPEWARQIDKMRLMPASGISNADAQEILPCLVAQARPAPVDAGRPAPDAAPVPFPMPSPDAAPDARDATTVPTVVEAPQP